MSLDPERSEHRCYVVIGPDAVSARRSESPEVAIVAIVDAASPIEAVLAQAAGADIVLPTSELDADAPANAPGLEWAIRAAGTIAHRRREIAESSRKVGHDLAGALNVISLAAELGADGTTDASQAFAQIATLARDAGDDAWRAGRTDRSFRRALTAIDAIQVVRDSTAASDVEVVVPAGPTWVFADERQLISAVDELILNARRSGAEQVRVEVRVDQHTVDIVIADDGPGFAPAQRDAIGEPFSSPASSGRLGLGLATIAEFAADLGGSFVVDTSAAAWSTIACLSLPVVESSAGELAARAMAVDQATAQAGILEAVVQRVPLAESLTAIVTAIESQIPDSICSVLLLRNGRTLHHGAGPSLPEAYCEAVDGIEIGLNQGSCGTAAFTGRPAIADDVTTDPNWVEFVDLATAHGLRSCWSTPIVAAGGREVLGTFAVYKTSVWRPDQAAIRLVQRFTHLASIAIEHRHLFDALDESESRFRIAFEGATAGMALVQLDGTLLKVNRSMARLVDQPEAMLLSSNLLDLVHPNSRDQVCAAWDQLAAQPEMPPDLQPTIEVPLAAAGAEGELWVSLSTSVVAAAGERYFYVEVRDMTASRRHLAEQRARIAAEISSDAKTDFLALVSHELRTPLNAILGFAQVLQLQDLELNDEQHDDSVDQIVSAGEHLRDLIDGLLDLSRIEAGQLAARPENIDTGEVIREALDLVAPLASSRDIALVHDRDQTAAFVVRADRLCLRQVLINLLGNAVKYTPLQGQVAVDIHEVGDQSVRIIVHDTGPGIAPESIDDLFQPFHRLGSPTSDGSEGTGLGLALAARLMAEMGGRIGVESTVGVGSSFWVEFPQAHKITSDAVSSSHQTPES